MPGKFTMSVRRSRRPKGLMLLVVAASVLFAGCGFIFDAQVISKSRDFVVISAGSEDTLKSLAARYLGDETKFRVIGEFNDIKRVRTGQEVVIPLRSLNRAGVYALGYRTVPILTYHRFSPSGKRCDRLAVSADRFARQLKYLGDKGYTVISLKDLADHIDGKKAIPRKAVVITIDDGYRSVYQIAYPILRKHGYAATIFVYSKFIGAPAGLTWTQMEEMVASGLIDIQPHSQSHIDLTKRLEAESKAAYLKRLDEEVNYPARQIKRKLDLPIHSFSYPYGAENDDVIAAVKSAGYRIGMTVTRGGNPAFAHPYALRRTQIYCGDSLRTFANRLIILQKASLE